MNINKFDILLNESIQQSQLSTQLDERVLSIDELREQINLSINSISNIARSCLYTVRVNDEHAILSLSLVKSITITEVLNFTKASSDDYNQVDCRYQDAEGNQSLIVPLINYCIDAYITMAQLVMSTQSRVINNVTQNLIDQVNVLENSLFLFLLNSIAPSRIFNYENLDNWLNNALDSFYKTMGVLPAFIICNPNSTFPDLDLSIINYSSSYNALITVFVNNFIREDEAFILPRLGHSGAFYVAREFNCAQIIIRPELFIKDLCCYERIGMVLNNNFIKIRAI